MTALCKGNKLYLQQTCSHYYYIYIALDSAEINMLEVGFYMVLHNMANSKFVINKYQQEKINLLLQSCQLGGEALNPHRGFSELFSSHVGRCSVHLRKATQILQLKRNTQMVQESATSTSFPSSSSHSQRGTEQCQSLPDMQEVS